MDYISVHQSAAKWGISERRVQKLCEDGRECGEPYRSAGDSK